jgi:hypothetical protein
MHITLSICVLLAQDFHGHLLSELRGQVEEEG